jgi:hypothetical protein
VEIITAATNSEIIASLNYAFIEEISNQAASLRQRAAHEKRHRPTKTRTKRKRQKITSHLNSCKGISGREVSVVLSDAGANGKASPTLLILIRLIAICFVLFVQFCLSQPHEDPQNRIRVLLFICGRFAAQFKVQRCKRSRECEAVSKIASKIRGNHIGAALLLL